VSAQFGAVSFYLEGDISKCFDKIDHSILMGIVESKIKDRRFTQLIWKALKAGYMEAHVLKASIVVTPQGSIISPLLVNVYLNRLDRFVEERMFAYNKGERSARNPQYRKHENLRLKALRAGDTATAAEPLKLMQSVPSCVHADPNFRRMYYVRYADD
jgi:retron-type reverse transcriptase